uniref:Uncharacterized protein n=1 Tax=Candidatus Kentrum sp. MB TaxID=2138164 RepID=A0A451BF87_9GAMM|nr:MAG: hypothetical protein BECKMB1821G_GA0114241_10804 [Candidatus Kentron sp. MB]VFK34779.1 MAG: hypothetical protein BECKMB1821I_GA0114274_10844 [Candidatus Kentron sp. MB]VFK76941.1 MAG: hypothetical protein BECKMB1821H_GA0114242_10854 [Candidatus Kentron sp. MB]
MLGGFMTPNPTRPEPEPKKGSRPASTTWHLPGEWLLISPYLLSRERGLGGLESLGRFPVPVGLLLVAMGHV